MHLGAGSGGAHEPFRRPFCRITARTLGGPGAVDDWTKFANDSLMVPLWRTIVTGRRPYLTASRLQHLGSMLSAEDISLLLTLMTVRVATGLQLQRLHHGAADDSAAKQRRVRQITRLMRLGLIARLERRIGGLEGGSLSTVYALDVAGQRVLNLEGRRRPPRTPSTPMIRHTVACTELYVRLVEADRRGVGELLDFDTEPRCWRRVISPGGHTGTLKPDADVTVGVADDELHWFIELDLDSESTPRITTKAQAYIDYFRTGAEQAHRGVTPMVLWIVPTTRRAAAIKLAVSRLAPEQRAFFSVAVDDDALRMIGGADSGEVES